MKKLTIEEFRKIPAGEIFANGILRNSPDELYMTDHRAGGYLRWIARKGYGNDWAVYCHWEENTIEWIGKQGDKVIADYHIQRCVPCTDAVFKRYRY